MDYSSLLTRVIQAVTRAGELLVAEWQRPEGPRGAGDKADVDVEIEALLRPCLLDLLDEVEFRQSSNGQYCCQDEARAKF